MITKDDFKLLLLLLLFLAFTVRLLTKRYIGEYDSTLGNEKHFLLVQFHWPTAYHVTCIVKGSATPNQVLVLSQKSDRLYLIATISLTSEETYRHRVEVDGQKILLEILDTAGQVSRSSCFFKIYKKFIAFTKKESIASYVSLS